MLVDEKNNPVGTLPKLTAHNANTRLHRGFSLFLFNKKGELLLQQRSLKKKTWPGVWSNSVCGHPTLEEEPTAAAKRRLALELGINNAKVTVILPDYRYRVEKNGVVENEFCPVMVGHTHTEPKLNPDEVRAIKWISWKNWLSEVKKHPKNYSPWSVEETLLLSENTQFASFLKLIQ